ncbi:MAG: hypothetical protein AAF667_16050 [Pseudomonadota bacterium]
MTDTSSATPKPPLGIGAIISESFSILFGNFLNVLILGFLGTFAGFLVNGLLVGFDAAAGQIDPTQLEDPSGFVVGSVISGIVTIAAYSLIIAMLVQLAYDAKLGRKGSLGAYFSSAIPALFAIVVLSVVLTILAMIGAIAIIIGALWVYAVFYVFVPAAVIERTGFGSLGRSATLTKEYRWPIVGLFVLMAIIVLLVSFIPGFIGALIFGSVGSGGVGAFIASGVVLSLINGLAYGLSGIATALTYARLREIKEGVAVDQIAAVFD